LKTCTKCGESKRPIDFYRKEAHCRVCRNKESLAYHHAHPDRARAKVKEWDNANPGIRAARSKEWYRTHPEAKKKWRTDNPDSAKRQDRASKLKSAYGLTIADFDRMLASQGGVCAVCSGPPNGRGAYHVDHDHDTGKIRGLLCHSCNIALGLVRDSQDHLAKLMAYLREAA